MKRHQRIYLDLCCLNRPFDDQTQDRIHVESEALLSILASIERGVHLLISSEALQAEIDQTPDLDRRQKINDILRLAAYHIRVGRQETARMQAVAEHGFGAYDALHISCAESANADVRLTTDDGFIRRVQRSRVTKVLVCNPLRWIAENEVR